MTYPTLTRRPKSEKVTYIDNYLSNTTESNHVIRRLRSTRKRKQWELTYDLLSNSDASQLIQLFDSTDCVAPFSWVDKQDITRTVVFDEPLSYSEPIPGWYRFDPIKLIEV